MYRKYILSILIIVLIALFNKISVYINIDSLNIIINAILLFSLGLSFNIIAKKRSSAWLGKLIISLVLLFFLLYELNLIIVPRAIYTIFNFIGLNSLIIKLIYIYCGWRFFA